ncbi:cytochrome C [Photobacterium profundum]|uniref:Monoheme cytochrome c n=1 Tax=Photobacterium profundum 3TCK TaxID=314280 RepID=Q1Z9U6_9GAMM|nr:c-type cytochrome [Photobacterium profundum]EAS45746.1 monoheme cytochrome c [Photobacterium profundum 3TCK]PSV63117.1 cytochrome C [Photobacterium profundum]
MHVSKYIVLGCFLLSFGTWAQEDAERAAITEYQPNLQRGAELVNNQCSGCHGDNVVPYVKIYPNLKGQKYTYLVKQLTAFKHNTRQDLFMQAQVKHLSKKDIYDVAYYYSQLQPLDLKKTVEAYLN